MPNSQLLNILFLAVLWGPSFLFIKLGTLEVSPLTLVTLRITLSTLFFLLLLTIKKIQLPRDPKLWLHCFVMGLIAASIPYVLYSYASEYIDSILCALVNGTTPVTTVLLANYFLKDEPFTRNRILGVTLGMAGFLVLFAPTVLDGDFSNDTVGMLLSFLAAFSYAIAMVYGRKFIVAPKQPLVLPTLQCLTSVFYLIPLCYLIDPPFHPMSVSLTFWGAVLGLSILGTVLAFIVYYKILMKYGATALSSVTYLLPIFSTVFGVFFLNEKLNIQFFIAATLILLGTMVANGLLPALNFRKQVG